MNCKPGDLAITLGCHPDYSGKIVSVLHRAVNGETLPNGNRYGDVSTEPAWVIEYSHDIPVVIVDGANRSTILSRFGVADDRRLRPIRDGEGQDETLTWVETPQPIAA